MRIGVYICHCGINIKATVDVAKLTKFAEKLPFVKVARDYLYMCSDPGQNLIKNDIEEFKLDRVVVAACSPRMHELTFRKVLESAGSQSLPVRNGKHPGTMFLGSPRQKNRYRKSPIAVPQQSRKVSLLEPLNRKGSWCHPFGVSYRWRDRRNSGFPGYC